jgi:histidine ammonia-lyase
MDSLKIMIANIADLLDRQLAQLVDHKMNHGLPRNLTGATADRLPLNHGFKAVQIGVSAWTAEALKQTLSASIFRVQRNVTIRIKSAWAQLRHVMLNV